MHTIPITFRMLDPSEAKVLECVALGVFDHEINAQWTAEFFADSRHHLAVALEEQVVVGMASGVHYVHPDKPPELFVNEVGVAPTHQNRGIGRQVLQTLLRHGHSLGCKEAWLGTELSNTAARRMYAAAGGEEEAEAMVIVWFNLDFEP
jgi:ribosomal protein S18 acetylase RimI-like enzyme